MSLAPPDRTLSFVDELKQDITSYLSVENAAAASAAAAAAGNLGDALLGSRGDARLSEWLSSGNRILCYCRPADTEAEIWRQVRSEYGLATGTSSSSYARAPPAPDSKVPGANAANSPRSSPDSDAPPPRPTRPPPTAPPWRSLFGVPPHPGSMRWPPRPTPEDVMQALGRARSMDSEASSAARGDSDSGGSNSGNSGDSEPAGENPTWSRARRQRVRRRKAPPKEGPGIGAMTSKCKDLLEFSSCFESGNLRYVVHDIDTDEYNLLLDNDVHSRGHTQWFFFAVRNAQAGKRYRIRICNMSKSKTLFRMGMRPHAWSELHAAEVLSGGRDWSEDASPGSVPLETPWAGVAELWKPAGEDVRYHRSRQVGSVGSNVYTLAFDYVFEMPDDTVFFAYYVPYTYSMLRATLSHLVVDPATRSWCRVKSMAGTLGEVSCDVLTISNFSVSRRMKKAVIVSSRVHPGESNASWIVHGLLGFLLSQTAEAQVLRDNFVWVIVPMLNPDGVISGNYRCGLCGTDLNRQWRSPNELLHAGVYSLKKIVARIKKSNGLCLYLDLHGHSRKCGIFAYACGQFSEEDHRRFTVRMYPKLLSLLIPEFNLFQCRWSVGKGKRGTGRVVVAKDIGVTNSYTIEASLWGSLDMSSLDTTNWEAAGAEECSGTSGAGSGNVQAEEEELRPAPAPNTPVVPGAEPFSGWQNGVLPFTVTKLQVFGANLARALLLQHNLIPSVQSRLRSQAGWNCVEGGPWPPLSKVDGDGTAVPEPNNSPCDSGSTTPSEASDGNEGDLSGGSDSDAQNPNGDLSPHAQERKVSKASFAAEPPWAMPSAAEPSSNLLGICTEDVMLELKSVPLSFADSDTGGSDSAPSEGNLAVQDLTRVGELLSRNRKPAKHKRLGSRGKTNGKRPMHKSSSKKELSTYTGSHAAGRTRTKSFGARRGSDRESGENAMDLGMPPGRGSRADLQKVVAFGQTTYLPTSGSAPNLGTAVNPSGGRGSSLSATTGFSAGTWRSPWPAIRQDDRSPGGGSASGDHAAALPGLSKDRFMQANPSNLAMTRMQREQKANSGQGNSPYTVLTRQLHMRHVSTSLLQLPRASNSTEQPHSPGPQVAVMPTGLAAYATAAVATGFPGANLDKAAVVPVPSGASSSRSSRVAEKITDGTGLSEAREASQEHRARPTTAGVKRQPLQRLRDTELLDFSGLPREASRSKEAKSSPKESPTGSANSVAAAAHLIAEVLRDPGPAPGSAASSSEGNPLSPGLPRGLSRTYLGPWHEDVPRRSRLQYDSGDDSGAASWAETPATVAGVTRSRLESEGSHSAQSGSAGPGIEPAEAAGISITAAAAAMPAGGSTSSNGGPNSRRRNQGFSSSPAAVAARAGRYLKS